MQRPLTGEPLAVDLLNTRWREGGGREVDLLGTVRGLRQWLTEVELVHTPATEQSRLAVTHTRDVLRRVVDGEAGAADQLNAVLARGVVVRMLDEGRPGERVLIADHGWVAAWRAAQSYLDLLAETPDGVRRCASHDCILYFYDPTGRRRWCSMSGCGNRAKARRHHARHQGRGDGSARLRSSPSADVGPGS
ncbi:MAG TPA: CGNR zinc finger domain-containing protein [Actinomycetales bacterium]|nr:CGNR zinc finger domain-containing protein [Actinomycetales bacterium]